MNFSLRWLFIGTLIVAFGVQYVTLLYLPIVDELIWVEATTLFYYHDSQLLIEPTYAYPGTVLLIPAYALQLLFALSAKHAFLLALAGLNAAAIAGIALVCKVLKPHSLWWVVAAGMMACSRFISLATPPSALVSFLIPLIFLVALYITTHHITSNRMALGLGALLGISLATRVDTSLLTCLMVIVFLWRSQYPIRFFGYGFLGGALSFFIFDPYLWFMPVQHLGDIIHKIAYHYETLPGATVRVSSLVFRDPFACAGLVLMTALLWHKTYFEPVERRLVEIMLLFSAIVIVGVTNARYHAAWYFFPLLNIWIIWLGRIVMTMPLTISLPVTFRATAQQPVTALLPWLFVGLFVGGSALMLIHLYSIPTGVFVLSMSR